MWHYKLGYLPFSTINRMSMCGELPTRLHKAHDPMCVACQYGKATRRAWRTKSTPNKISGQKTITKAGQCVSIDQMVSPIPGLIAQMKGIPTKARYTGATIFVDHFSDITYVHLQKSLSAAETIEAKHAFERWTNSCGVKVTHYHADNGRFAETAFMADVAVKGQTISFCGVNAHFQNGRAERRIRSLQDMARTQLLHAAVRWPTAITTNLWPYAITNVSNSMNDSPAKDQKVTRMERFTQSGVRPNLKHHHHIGVPVYVLINELQSGKKVPK